MSALPRLSDVPVSCLPRGTGFTRFATALLRSRGDILSAAKMAEAWRDSPQVALALRGAVDYGTTTDVTWASTLSAYQQIASEFIELLRPASVIGRIPYRSVPFNIQFPRQIGNGAVVQWLGQGAPTPVSDLSFEQDSIGVAKAGGAIVLSQELIKSSSPAAEGIVRNELVAALAKYLDRQFLDPSVSAVANVSPASITNGASAITSTGSTAAAVSGDLVALFGLLNNAGCEFRSPVLIMKPATALAIALKRDTAGGAAFPDVKFNGGTLMGVPVIVSANAPGSASGGNVIILVDAADINVAEGPVTLDTSTEAALQLDSAPSAGAQNLVSLWAQNLAAVRAIRYINWKLRHVGSVGYLDAVNY